MKFLMIAILMLPCLAFAKPADKKIYAAACPKAETSCKTCHTTGKELNDFGKKYGAIKPEDRKDASIQALGCK